MEKRRGGREHRRLQSSNRLNEADGTTDWPGLAQVCRIVRTVKRAGKTTQEIDYAITSVPRKQAKATQLLSWWRGHWGIENRSHYVRDVTLGEDASRIRKGHAPQNMAALRNAIVSLFRSQGEENIAAATRKTAWNIQRLRKILGIFEK